MKYFKFALMVAGIFALLWAAPVEAQGVWGACEGNSTSAVCAEEKAPDIIKIVIDTLLYFVGALSVVFIIWSGMKYVTSAGNPEVVKSAKSTLLYAVIGLVVASLAFAIVNIVIDTADPPKKPAPGGGASNVQ